MEWLVRGDRPIPITPARDPAWGEAVAWLRLAWRDSGRRDTVVGVLTLGGPSCGCPVVGVLKALAAPLRSAGPR